MEDELETITKKFRMWLRTLKKLVEILKRFSLTEWDIAFDPGKTFHSSHKIGAR